MPELHILWLYPDVLHLHGERGNAMALCHVAELLGLHAEIRRVNDLHQPIDFAWADLVLLNSCELRVVPTVVAALQAQQAQLMQFVEAGKMIFASGSSGAILAKSGNRLAGGPFQGLGLLDMHCEERQQIYGDDIWFTLPDGNELIGNQIQVMDTHLAQPSLALGRTIYGYGNCKQGDEGARSGNLIFTNCLGPVLVKNPAFAATLISQALAVRGLEVDPALPEAAIAMEQKSFDLIKAFIHKKMA